MTTNRNLPDGDWQFEIINSNLVFGHIVKEKYYDGKSEYQEVQVLNLGSFGKCLMIDDHVQSSETDEFIYHECLVQPVLHLHPNPRSVFIAGGGEGATAREILRHKTVERLVMVDIDDIVVKVSKEFLPKHHAGAFEDKRMELVQDDALKWLENTTEKFDVIVMDLPDPIEEGPAYLLYTQKFYTMLKSKLNVGGLVVTQSGPGGPTSYSECFTPIYATLSTVFGAVRPYSYYVPSFGDCNGFNIAAVDDGSGSVESLKNIPSIESIDARIKERFGDESPFRFFDGLALQGLFSLAKFIRKGLADEKRIITEENPLVCFQD